MKVLAYKDFENNIYITRDLGFADNEDVVDPAVIELADSFVERYEEIKDDMKGLEIIIRHQWARAFGE